MKKWVVSTVSVAIIAILLVSGSVASAKSPEVPNPLTIIFDEIANLWGAIDDVNGEIADLWEALAKTPQTHYLSIPAAAFTPDQIYPGFYRSSQGTHLGQLDDSGSMSAAVYLPDGALVTGFEVYVVDDNADFDLGINLMKRTPGTSPGGFVMANVVSDGAPYFATLTETDDILWAEIDNSSAYYEIVAVWLNGGDYDLRLQGALITYTINE